ncbi:MAG: TIGR02266 family protein [Myxococcaceae bacterium]|nr:TIGR02266 family protein [Myxococcaceae bacterium]
MSADAVLVIDPSSNAVSATLPPIVAAGARVHRVTSMTEALDAARSFSHAMMIADVAAAPPKPERVSEAARHAGSVPLVLLGQAEVPSPQLEAWSNLGATDLVMRPLKLADVQLRLGAAKSAAPAEGSKRPRRVLLASDDALDLHRLDAVLQLNGFYVLPVDLTMRSLELNETFDVLVVSARSPAAPLLHQLRHKRGLETVPAVVLSAGAPLAAEPHLHVCLHVNAPADDVVRAVSGDRRVHPQLRVHQRVPFFSVVEFREAGNAAGRWLAGFSSNLSPGGVFVRSLAMQRVGSALELRMHVAEGHEVLEGSGVVAWANAWGTRGGFHFSVGMGLQFLGMNPKSLMRIRAICSGE